MPLFFPSNIDSEVEICFKAKSSDKNFREISPSLKKSQGLRREKLVHLDSFSLVLSLLIGLLVLFFIS